MHLVFISCVQIPVEVVGGGAVPIITLDPDVATEIPNWTPLGAIVVIVHIIMSDDSPYLGTPFLTDPSGIYTLVGEPEYGVWYIIVDPNGPGVGTEAGNTSSLTITAN